MRRFSLLFLLAFLLHPTFAQQPVVKVQVDKRIELLRVVWNLSVMKYLDEELHPTTSDYQQEVAVYFKKFKRHKAVKKIRKVWIGDYSFPTLGLELTEDYAVPKKPSPKLQEWLERYGEEELRSIFSLIKQFAIDTDFDKFYQQHLPEYQLMVAPVQTHLDTSSWISEVVRFFGGEGPEIVEIYFDPLNNIGNTEISTENRKVSRVAMAYLGDVNDENKDTPVRFSIAGSTRRILYHELTHYYTSTLTTAASERLRAKKALFIEEENTEEVPDIVWLNTLDETIVRAITAYLFKVAVSEEVGLQEIGYQEGYSYADEIYNFMDYYFNNEEIYPDIRSFHPKLIDFIMGFE